MEIKHTARLSPEYVLLGFLYSQSGYGYELHKRLGDEFGFIKFGSRVDLFLPLSAKIKVNIGDVTKGGKTIIAEL